MSILGLEAVKKTQNYNQIQVNHFNTRVKIRPQNSVFTPLLLLFIINV